MKKVLFLVAWLFATLLQAQDSTQNLSIAQTTKAKPKSSIHYFTLYAGTWSNGGHLQSIFFNNWGLDFS